MLQDELLRTPRPTAASDPDFRKLLLCMKFDRFKPK